MEEELIVLGKIRLEALLLYLKERNQKWIYTTEYRSNKEI